MGAHLMKGFAKRIILIRQKLMKGLRSAEKGYFLFKAKPNERAPFHRE